VLAWAACAAKEPKLAEPEPAVPLPEVTRIVLQGNTTFGSRELRKVMATKQRPLFPPWKRGEPYNPPTVEADLRRLKKFYFDRGFLDTTVTLGKVQEDADARTVQLEILLEEGPPTLVHAVQLEGPLPPELPAVDTLLAELPLHAGERITRENFEKSKDLLLLRLHDAGYARAQLVPHTEVDPQTHRATVTFQVYPGSRTVFGRITVTGAQQVNTRAIQRKITIREGDIYSANKLTESADAIYGLGTFQAVTPRALNLEAADEPLDIEIEVRERKPRTIQLGAGYSTVESLRLKVEWTHRNLFGGAESLTLLGKASGIEQAFEARLHLPYFLYPRTSFTQTFFVRNEQEVSSDPLGFLDDEAQPAFDLFTVGAEARMTHQFSRRLTASLGLQLSVNKFSNVNTEALPNEELAEDNTLLVPFVEAYWNSTDNLLNPTRGLQLRGRLEYSNTALVSDVSFAKMLLEARHYRPLWWKMILATRLEIGTIQPYGDTEDVPFNVRFFAGGPGSVRGFALNRLGPLDSDGDPIGGHSLLEGSLEVRFPIVGALGGVVFVDFGNVYEDAFTYRLGELRYAVGPGLRYNTPVGPVRVDFGVIIDRRSGEDFGRLELSIGQAF
jgi:outer membrane protein assembly complex protein YaeT